MGRPYGGLDKGPFPASIVDVDTTDFDNFMAGLDTPASVQDALNYIDDNALDETAADGLYLRLDGSNVPTADYSWTTNFTTTANVTANTLISDTWQDTGSGIAQWSNGGISFTYFGSTLMTINLFNNLADFSNINILTSGNLDASDVNATNLLTDNINAFDNTSVFDLSGAGLGSVSILTDLEFGAFFSLNNVVEIDVGTTGTEFLNGKDGGQTITLGADFDMNLFNINNIGIIQTGDLWADNYYDAVGNFQWGQTDGSGNFTFDGTVTIAQVLTTTAITLELDTVDIIGGSFLSSVDWGSATWTTLGNVGIGQAAGTEKLEITGLKPNILLTNNENAQFFLVGFPNAAGGEPALSTSVFGGGIGRIFQRQSVGGGGSNDVFMGDIDATGGGVNLRTNGVNRLEVSNAGVFNFLTYQLNTTSDLSSFGKTTFKSDSGSPNIATTWVENSGSQSWSVGVDSLGILKFYLDASIKPALEIDRFASGNRWHTIANAKYILNSGAGGWADVGYTFKGNTGAEVGGLFAQGGSALTKFTLGTGWNDDRRTDFVQGSGQMDMYGGTPGITQHVLRASGGVAINAFEHSFQKGSTIATGGNDTTVMIFGTHGDIDGVPDPTADYAYIGVGVNADVTKSGFKTGFNGGIAQNKNLNQLPLFMLESFQFDDDRGYKLFGFDDLSAEFLHSYIDASGNANIDATGILELDPVNGVNIEGNYLLPRADGNLNDHVVTDGSGNLSFQGQPDTGEFYSNSSGTLTILTANEWHPGINQTVGIVSGMTVDAGEAGSITQIVQNGSDITISANNTMEVGDPVSLLGGTGYDDVYIVTAVTATTFDVTAAFVADGTGTFISPQHFDIVTAGRYTFHGNFSGNPASGTPTFEFGVFVNATLQDKGNPIRKFANAVDVGNAAGTLKLQLAIDDKVWFAARNTGGTQALTIVSSNVNITWD